MKFLKWVVGVVVVVAVLAVAAILILPQVVPMDRVVAEAEAQVQAATGRKLVVGGEPELSLWPEVAIRVGDVAFANAEGAPDPNMATAEAVRIAVPVLPLLSGEIEVKEFVLVKPDIRLYVDKNGKPNWAFDAGQAAGGGQASGGQASGGDAAGGGLPSELKGLKLGDVRIEDGRVSYTDARTGATETAENIDMAVSLPSMAGPLALDGGLDWKGESIKLDLQMAKPVAATEGGKSALALNASSKHFEARFDGEADFAKGFGLAGAAAFKTPSLKALSAWAAQPIEMEGDVLGPVEAKGQLAMTDGRIAFTGADLAIDAIRGKGDFAIATGGAVPTITAKLALGALDLNPYMASPKDGGGSGSGGRGGSGPAKWS
ncbi:MAG: AsmA family protein, partial [Alphaproteobacteria bacterium]